MTPGSSRQYHSRLLFPLIRSIDRINKFVSGVFSGNEVGVHLWSDCVIMQGGDLPANYCRMQ